MVDNVKVLVVDDDRRMVRTICDILRIKGYQAEPAYTGEEAVEKVKTWGPDCVLMDIKMPGMDGVKALNIIKSLMPGLPVVLMSAYATDEQIEEAKRQGAYAVLTKPVDLQLVLSFVSLVRKEESILIVDDDPVFSATLKDILQARGYRVETEVDPDKVLRHMEHDYKLVVILDLKLGKADGLDVLKEIRMNYPSKPVVMVTGYGSEMAATIEKGLQIGAHACLYKPLETNELLSIIEQISRHKIRNLLGDPVCATDR
jgi:two-component system, NtrC family, response regulator HydG